MIYEIYGRNNCVWCDRAKELLDASGAKWEFRNIEENSIHLMNFKELFPGKKTVPQIRRINEPTGISVVIGGYEELARYLYDV